MSTNIVDRLEEDIRLLVEQDELRGALEELRLFSMDFSSELKNDVTHLLSRFNRHEKQRRSSIALTENINEISFSILELLQKIRLSAKAPIALSNAPLAPLGDMNEKIGATEGGESHASDANQLRRQIIRRAAEAGASNPLVVLKGIEKSFGPDRFCLGPVDCTLEPGQVSVVFGNNGSGKTTLLNIVAGNLKPTSGTVKYFEQDTPDWISIKTQIAFISSKHMTSKSNVRETLEYVAAACGKLGKANRDAIDDYLARYDLESFGDTGWSQLSDGYLMRVELIRSLISSPKVLILDEPLAHLDSKTQATFLSELTELTAIFSNPASILLSTHHVAEAELVADQFIIMDQGKCKFCGTKKQLRAVMKGSIFRVLGVRHGIFPKQFELIQGLRTVIPILGGVELAFDDTVSLKDMLERLKGIELDAVSTITEVSASPRSILSGSVDL